MMPPTLRYHKLGKNKTPSQPPSAIREPDSSAEPSALSDEGEPGSDDENGKPNPATNTNSAPFSPLSDEGEVSVGNGEVSVSDEHAHGGLLAKEQYKALSKDEKHAYKQRLKENETPEQKAERRREKKLKREMKLEHAIKKRHIAEKEEAEAVVARRALAEAEERAHLAQESGDTSSIAQAQANLKQRRAEADKEERESVEAAAAAVVAEAEAKEAVQAMEASEKLEQLEQATVLAKQAEEKEEVKAKTARIAVSTAEEEAKQLLASGDHNSMMQAEAHLAEAHASAQKGEQEAVEAAAAAEEAASKSASAAAALQAVEAQESMKEAAQTMPQEPTMPLRPYNEWPAAATELAELPGKRPHFLDLA